MPQLSDLYFLLTMENYLSTPQPLQTFQKKKDFSFSQFPLKFHIQNCQNFCQKKLKERLEQQFVGFLFLFVCFWLQFFPKQVLAPLSSRPPRTPEKVDLQLL